MKRVLLAWNAFRSSARECAPPSAVVIENAKAETSLSTVIMHSQELNRSLTVLKALPTLKVDLSDVLDYAQYEASADVEYRKARFDKWHIPSGFSMALWAPPSVMGWVFLATATGSVWPSAIISGTIVGGVVMASQYDNRRDALIKAVQKSHAYEYIKKKQ